MAIIKKPKHDDGPVNEGEQRLFDFLRVKLPDDYYLVPNVNVPIMGKNKVMKYWEYDCIVVAPHGVYQIENKNWFGSLIGDDNAWFRDGVEKVNPHKTAGYKTRILASKIKNDHPDWKFGEIVTLVTLSYPRQSKVGFDPNSACYKQTFVLGNELIDFLTDSDRFYRGKNGIKDLQKGLVDYLTGMSAERIRAERTELLGYRIEEKLQETADFTEYLCVPKLLTTAKYKIREYPIDKAGKSPAELDEMLLQMKNSYNAQCKIGDSPYIVRTECKLNDEQTYYYEISKYQDESTLRSQLQRKTFKQTEKINIILNVAYALKEAHKENVYHRDVCPENIYVYDGGKAALANFGSSWFQEHVDLEYTMNIDPNSMSPYTAPELMEDDVCAGSDLYSLGVIFYELMTGVLPFDNVLSFTTTYGGMLSDELLPSHRMKELPSWMDEVVKHTIVEDMDNRWGTADELINFINESLEKESAQNGNKTDIRTTPKVVTIESLDDFKPGMKVSPSMTLHEVLGHGGFSRVFKVWHDMQNQYLAIKIFDKEVSIDNALNEFSALNGLKHRNIVEFKNNDRTVPGDFFYTLMELLEGENLMEYTKGDLRLPVDEVYKMAMEVLDALVYMQEQNPPIYHRDIKPSNIMWHKRSVYKLIDFNIASNTDDKSFGGTFPYMAPDLVRKNSKIDWDCSADTFSLGVTIYELLAHAYPWPGSGMRPNMNVKPRDIRECNDKLSDGMAEFVMKSIATDRTQRYATAKEMQRALEKIGAGGVLKDTQQLIIINSDKDVSDPVDYLNSLYSQSHHGNVGTRANANGSVMDKLTYTRTKLDETLIADIKELKYKLIIITGNAGDGKTAFIHKIEEVGENRRHYETNNGSEFEISGVKFRSNYDGSQDENDELNEEVLSRFFSPFYGLNDCRKATEGRVIAINEGRLVDFLSMRPELKMLEDNIEEYFYQEGRTELMPGLMVINLNLRSVTARDGDRASLLAQQVKKLTDPVLWTKCAGCPIADRCYIKYNVDTFQDSSSGDEVIKRLEWLVRTIMYKRELHITMRDMRSMIAWMLTRDYSCEEVKRLVAYVQLHDDKEFYWQYYYFNLTSPIVMRRDDLELPTMASSDRLVKLLRETDVAGVALPSYDRDLYYTKKKAENYLMFSDRNRTMLTEFNGTMQLVPIYEIKSEDERMMITERQKVFVRHQYFEGAFDFRRRLPYRYVSRFEEQMRKEDGGELEQTKQDLAMAISASEGCSNRGLTHGYLLLASTSVNDPMSKSYRRFPLEEFELFVNKSPHLTKYIEYESDSMTFRHKRDKFIQLTISLDLYEMLQYIRAGFSPSINDLRGRFIELQIFKNLLEAKTYSEVLVTKNNRKYTIIRLNENKKIVFEPLNIESL